MICKNCNKHTLSREDESFVSHLLLTREPLLVTNYLSEYKEEWQKKRVRDNIGITRELSSTEERLLDELNKLVGVLNLSKFDRADIKLEGVNVYITFFAGEKEKLLIKFITESTPIEDIERLIRNIIEETSTWEKGAGEHSVQTKGTECLANGDYSVAEGLNTRTNHSGRASHAEGSGTIASGIASHAEGNTSESKADYSHAEGGGTVSDGVYSHTEGEGTVTNNIAEHAEGRFNKSHSYKDGDLKDTAHSIGIGTSMFNRKNAIEIMLNGDVYIINIGNYNGSDIDLTNTKTIQTVISQIENALSTILGSIEGIIVRVGNTEQTITLLNTHLEEDELVIAQALNNLNTRIDNILTGIEIE